MESVPLPLSDNSSRRTCLALEALRLKTTDDSSLTAVLQATELFPSYCIHMPEIEELTGRLDTVLAVLSGYYKREHALNETIQRAVIYPCVMAALTALIFLILLRRILPILPQVFSLFDSGMSPATSFPLGQNPADFAVLIDAAVALFPVAVLALTLFHSRWGLAVSSRGKSSAAIGRTRFASAMSLMISSGFGMNEALKQTGKLLGETLLAFMCADCQKWVNDGTPFTEAVTDSGIFSGMEAGMLIMGFCIGTIENVMEELARKSQLSVDMWLNQSLNRFEYGLVILLCVTMGGVLLTVMLPLLQMLASPGG